MVWLLPPRFILSVFLSLILTNNVCFFFPPHGTGNGLIFSLREKNSFQFNRPRSVLKNLLSSGLAELGKGSHQCIDPVIHLSGRVCAADEGLQVYDMGEEGQGGREAG